MARLNLVEHLVVDDSNDDDTEPGVAEELADALEGG
jgi:hypothetical protein